MEAWVDGFDHDLTQGHGAEDYRLVIDRYAAVTSASQVFLQSHICWSKLSCGAILHLNLHILDSNYKDLKNRRLCLGDVISMSMRAL